MAGVAIELTVNPTTLHLEDEQSRTRIFHGTNVVYKAAPFVPILDHFDAQYSFSPRDIEYLITWGVRRIQPLTSRGLQNVFR